MKTLFQHAKKMVLIGILPLALGGCVATMKEQVLDSTNESQLQKRSYQKEHLTQPTSRRSCVRSSPRCKTWGF